MKATIQAGLATAVSTDVLGSLLPPQCTVTNSLSYMYLRHIYVLLLLALAVVR